MNNVTLPTGPEAAILFWITFGTIIFVGLTYVFLVYVTRRSLLFGVRIPDDQTRAPEVLALKLRYCVLVAIATVITLVVYYFLSQISTKAMLGWSLGIYLPYLLLYGVIYIYCWKKALALKTEKGWDTSEKLTASLAFRTKAAGTDVRIPWGWYLTSLVILAGIAALSLMKYELLPDMIPTHFDISMQPDAWSPKTIWTALSMPFVGIGIILLMIGSTWMVYRQKMQIDYENPALSYAQHRAYRTLMGHRLGLLTLSMMPLFALSQLSIIEMIPSICSKLDVAGHGNYVCRNSVLGIHRDASGARWRQYEARHYAGRSCDGLWL